MLPQPVSTATWFHERRRLNADDWMQAIWQNINRAEIDRGRIQHQHD